MGAAPQRHFPLDRLRRPLERDYRCNAVDVRLSGGGASTRCYDLVFRHALDVDDSGDRLAFGSTTGSLWISENGGDSWATVSSNLPPIYAMRFEKEQVRTFSTSVTPSQTEN
jgi:hypothetical protein